MNKIEFDLSIVIDEYSNYVYKIVNNIAGKSLNRQDKEEILSDTFYLLWKNQKNIKDNLKSYLSAIARNCTYRRLQKCEIAIDLDENLIATVENIERVVWIKEKLNALNDNEREIFELHYVYGLKIKEIANITGKTCGSIKMVLLRIRKKFKEDF